ncbi:hypothetical protein BH10PLA1_BH10PLA1_13010 [soil metagenome]
MSARRLFLAATVTVSSFVAFAPVLTPAVVFGQDVTAPAVDNAKFNFQGVINSGGVNVRSGPGDNYYATAKLDKGAAVTVVGIRFDWLKVTPPEGSFSYVAKAYVTRFGDGTKGKVDKPDLRVRAGSSQNAMKTTVQTTLNVGDEVSILGEADEYYKITPPTGVYLYVNKQFVDAVKSIDPIAATPAEGTSTGSVASATPAVTTAGPSVAPTTVTPTSPDTTTKTETPTVAVAPSTQPSAEVAVAPSTQPAAPTAEATFDKLEADFVAMSANSLDQQPLAETITSYQALTSSTLPESLKRIVDLRLATLKARLDAQGQFIALKKSQEEAGQRQVAMKAEQQELQDRIEKNRVSMFTAVGTLRTSSLQQGQTMLYRLTDPGTGRTVVYIRTNDTKYTGLLGQFIGVKGDLTTDQQLSIKVITPTDAVAVDQAKVNNGVTAEVIPPSLLPRTLSAAQ